MFTFPFIVFCALNTRFRQNPERFCKEWCKSIVNLFEDEESHCKIRAVNEHIAHKFYTHYTSSKCELQTNFMCVNLAATISTVFSGVCERLKLFLAHEHPVSCVKLPS